MILKVATISSQELNLLNPVHLQGGKKITEWFKLGSDAAWERVKRSSAYAV